MSLISDLQFASIVPDGLPLSLIGVVATVVIGIIYSILTKERPFAGFPLAAIQGQSPKKSWLFHGPQTLAEALAKYSGPFQVMTGTGPKIVLPNRFADEIRNNPSLNFQKAFLKVRWPLEWEMRTTSSPKTVRVKLTQSLGLVTDDLVDETTAALRDIYGESPEWTTAVLKDGVTDLVARLSSRVFLGKDVCRNERWLQIATTYTVDSFIASYIMRMAPTPLRFFVYWFVPQGRSIRQAVRDARQIIDPEVKRRIAAVDAARAAGLKPPKTADTLGWMYEVARGRKVDYPASQLSLTMAAIHTTTETTGQAMLDICELPDVAQQLREEIIQVIGEHGWSKNSVTKLKLMDSFLKESSRVHPLNLRRTRSANPIIAARTGSMNRYVEQPVELSDGTVLPKGSRIMVAANFADPVAYPSPATFDAARFLRRRQEPGQEHAWQFVTTTPEHMHFGHGEHACPGRFFAAHLDKVALCHLLLKYEWRFVPADGGFPKPDTFETGFSGSRTGQVQFRRRQEEIVLDL
ncbi:cytochrome P450 [Apiospora aurea]|uniref:Cytochrome P450 n=1 Tax=Apiospora aurea TaxID=335848 RepID=A0ABR1QAJ7_9PEZI